MTFAVAWAVLLRQLAFAVVSRLPAAVVVSWFDHLVALVLLQVAARAELLEAEVVLVLVE